MLIVFQYLAAASISLSISTPQGMPVVPRISASLPDSIKDPLIAIRKPLAEQKLALLEKGKRLNTECKGLQAGSAQHGACLGRMKEFSAMVDSLRVEMDRLSRTIDIAVAREVTALTARDQNLTAWIARDVLAIKRLGFDRRAEDFEAWEALADDARKDFERDMCDAVANMPTGLRCPQMAVALPTLWVASIRNNVTRRQALREVKLLNKKTDRDLKALARIDQLMVKHVKERRELRSKLKSLQEGT